MYAGAPKMSRADAGFSLLEVMVALVVFSLGAMALLNVVGESTRAQTASGDRSVALIVAENRLVEAMATTEPPALGETSGVEHALGRDWSWRMGVAPTNDPRILRIDVRVTGAEETETLAELATFRAAAR